MVVVFGWAFLAIGALGVAYQLFSARQLGRLAVAKRRLTAGAPARPPAVTILKPLHGDEPGLYVNLESFCLQDYAGPLQILFGVHDIADPAIGVVRELQRAHPKIDITLVVDGRIHGENRKVCNLINMARAIRGDVVVLSDSDIHAPADCLDEVVAPLADPAVGFVTSLYTGRAAGSPWASLSAMGINYQFLPNVLAGVRLGMASPCFGAMIALRRQVLDEIGGFAVLADQLADDYDLGRAIRKAGYRGELAPTPVAHLCAETGWRELWSHEARWSRTIRAIDPWGYLGSAVTHPIPWALAGCLLSFSPLALLFLACATGARLYLVGEVDRATGSRARNLPLLPLRDLISFAVFLSAFFGRSVTWRGRRFRVGSDGALIPDLEPAYAEKLVSSGAVLRRFRRRRGIAIPGEARDQVVLVSDLARPASRLGREQPIDRRPAA